MASWRDELIEVIKTKAERDAEEQARHRKRVEEALATAEAAMALGVEGLRFTTEHLRGKAQPAELVEAPDSYKITLHDLSLALELVREGAIIKITFGRASRASSTSPGSPHRPRRRRRVRRPPLARAGARRSKVPPLVIG